MNEFGIPKLSQSKSSGLPSQQKSDGLNAGATGHLGDGDADCGDCGGDADDDEEEEDGDGNVQ